MDQQLLCRRTVHSDRRSSQLLFRHGPRKGGSKSKKCARALDREQLMHSEASSRRIGHTSEIVAAAVVDVVVTPRKYSSDGSQATQTSNAPASTKGTR
jgi:hypothetical protein